VGDSVTFGHGWADDNDILVNVAAREFQKDTGVPIQPINISNPA